MSCAHVPSSQETLGAPQGQGSVLGTRPIELSWGPRSAPCPPPSWPSDPPAPARASSTRASPPSLSQAAAAPQPPSGFSRAAQSLLPAPNLHPVGAPGDPFHRHRLGPAAWPGVSAPARPREGPPRPAPEAWPSAGEGGGDVVRGQRLQGCRGAGRCLSGNPGLGEQLAGVGKGPHTGEGAGGSPQTRSAQKSSAHTCPCPANS